MSGISRQQALAALVSEDRSVSAGLAVRGGVASAGAGSSGDGASHSQNFNHLSSVNLSADDGASYEGSIFNVVARPGLTDRAQVIANFEELKHQLTRVYKQEAYAQSYMPVTRDGLSAIVIKPLLGAVPNDVKINCHYAAYTEQGLGALQGAYDLLRIRMSGDLSKPGRLLEQHLQKFLAEMKSLDASMSDEVRAKSGHKIFEKKLEEFNREVVNVLSSYIPSEDLKKDLEQARLWAPLAFQPKSYVVQDPDGDVTVREPVIVQPGADALTMKSSDPDSLKAKLFEYHQESLSEGRLIPTQLTDQSIKIDGIGARNSWLVTSFQGGHQVSQVTSSGLFSFNSVERATHIFESTKSQISAMTGARLDVMVPATLTTDAHVRDIGKMFKGGNEKTARDVYARMSRPSNSVSSASVSADSDSSPVPVSRSPSPEGEAGAGSSGSESPVPDAGSTGSGFKFISSPLFMRSLGTVEDQSTLEVIESLFSVGGPLRSEGRISVLKGFLDLDSSSGTTDNSAAARQQVQAMIEIRAETDPKKKRLMHALLTWKMLDFNQNHKGSEPFNLVLDQLRTEMGGERPIYHIWQLALSAMIHEGAQSLLNIQCKSGKDRTGMALACHQILNKTYDAEYGFLGRGPLSEPNAGKDRFIAARDIVMRRGDIQLAASEGGTQGCFGVMDNGEVRGVFSRIFGIAKDDPRSGILVSKQGNGRKEIKVAKEFKADKATEFEPVSVSSRSDQLKVLVGVFGQTEPTSRVAYLEANAEGLNKAMGGAFSGLRGSMGLTSSGRCAGALKSLFEMLAATGPSGNVLTNPGYGKVRAEAVTTFEKVLIKSGLSDEEKAAYNAGFKKGLDGLIAGR